MSIITGGLGSSPQYIYFFKLKDKPELGTIQKGSPGAAAQFLYKLFGKEQAIAFARKSGTPAMNEVVEVLEQFDTEGDVQGATPEKLEVETST